MDWYYSKNGAQQGPAKLEEMQQLLAQGDISATDLVWHEGMADWMPAGQVAELGGSGVGSGGYAAAVGGAGGVAGLGGYAGGVAPPRQGLGIASMVCGIVGLLGFCTVVLGLVLGIAAVITGHLAKGKIRREPATYGGGGFATAGLITGYLAIVLGAAYGVYLAWMLPAQFDQIQQMQQQQRIEMEQEWADESADESVEEELELEPAPEEP